MSEEAWVSWSCGKDSALALAKVRTGGGVVAGLLTTTVHGAEVAMSRVPVELLRRQAVALGLPVEVVDLPWPCPNEVYERAMATAHEKLQRDGITHMVFGDLFLEDVRAYREQKLGGTGITPVFPLWKRPTLPLAHAMIESGLEAYLATVDLKHLPAEFAGRRFDLSLLADLPGGVDPCGENGEFHTCVVAASFFSRRLPVATGERVERDGYAYCDLVME